MQTRYMDRSNSMAREKRSLDSASAEEAQPDRKRPALARYFLLPFQTILFNLCYNFFCFFLIFEIGVSRAL